MRNAIRDGSTPTRVTRMRVTLTRVALTSLALVLLVPALALAHAVVFPRTSTPGAYEKYVLRVPNEKNVATTRVEMRFPADVKVVSFADVEGWQLQVLTDSAGRITGAAWTGTLQPQRFVEFPFVAVNPKNAARIVWPAYQTYADGDRVEWTGPETGKTPASMTTIAVAAGTVAEPARAGGIPWLAAAALVIALVSLGLAMRRPEPRVVAR